MASSGEDSTHLVLLAAALLRVGARRLRALALGESGGLAAWLAGESALRLAEARRDARLAAAQLERLGARMVALGDCEYPPALRDLRDPPAFLTYRGTLVSGGIAIVGSRAPVPAAARFARDLARRLDAPIVSGLAYGIDAAAHCGALDRGGASVAYVGNGLGVSYPPEHRELEERIVACGGAIATEQLPFAPVTRWSLVRRDRLQAAHAGTCVLIASEPGGGAMHTMRFARALGRRRYALEARADPRFAGNSIALAEGAGPLPWDVRAAAELLCAT